LKKIACNIYEDLVVRYNALFSKAESDKFYRFDSPIITLTAKLLKDDLNFRGKAYWWAYQVKSWVKE